MKLPDPLPITTRAEALAIIEDLYGVTSEWVRYAHEELGDNALTDAALIAIAKEQQTQELRDAAAYADEIPDR